MPVLKASDPLPERPVVIALYGEPGSCKTTLGNTASGVLVLDFDRGVSRSAFRQDTVIINSWHDVITEEKSGTFKSYQTVVIDTAKAALDDFLMSYVIERDFKLKGNKLRAYGEIGDEFKLFLNNRRNEGLDVIIIAHAKKDEDTKKAIPDVTGQSYQLILRVADQVGYVSFVNNERNIQWTPTDLTIGKNTANLPMMKVPDISDLSLKTFMANVIIDVKKSIVRMSDSQREALDKAEKFSEAARICKDFEELHSVLAVAAESPQVIMLQVLATIKVRALELINGITKVEDMNAALTLFSTKPLQLTNDVMNAMKKVQEGKGYKFDKDNRKFFDPAPPPPPPAEKPKRKKGDELSEAIPGESFTHEREEVTTPELAFA
jgi:hypothetical protein